MSSGQSNDRIPNGYGSHAMPLSNGINNSHDAPTKTEEEKQKEKKKKKKTLILNAFVEMCSGHQSPGLWRHPRDRSSNFNTLPHWTALAQLLERGAFHGLFIADVLGGYDIYQGPGNLSPAIKSGAQWPVNEPLSVVPAMAAVTSSLSFGVTISTSYEQPYHLARRLSTVDHLTQGRLGWNVVTGYLDSAARNLTNGASQPAHDERYAMCEEYMQVVYKLWNSSWRSDAVRLDRERGIYTDPNLVREIRHEGKFFTVPGPHFCQPSPQRTPVIMQAGTSRAGKEFAAKHAEAIFVSQHSPKAVAGSIKDIRERAEALGRDPGSIKVLAKFCPVLGRTQEEADARYRDYAQYGDAEGALALFGGWTGVDMALYGDDEELRYVESNAIRSYIEGLLKTAPDVNGGKWTKKTLAQHIVVGGLGATCVGTPEKVADEMERWVAEGGVDGFNIAYALMPGTFEDVVELLIPELRRRGLFWEDYCVPGGTYRENLNEKAGQKEPLHDHPAAKMIWRPERKTGGFALNGVNGWRGQVETRRAESWGSRLFRRKDRAMEIPSPVARQHVAVVPASAQPTSKTGINAHDKLQRDARPRLRVCRPFEEVDQHTRKSTEKDKRVDYHQVGHPHLKPRECRRASEDAVNPYLYSSPYGGGGGGGGGNEQQPQTMIRGRNLDITKALANGELELAAAGGPNLSLWSGLLRQQPDKSRLHDVAFLHMRLNGRIPLDRCQSTRFEIDGARIRSVCLPQDLPWSVSMRLRTGRRGARVLQTRQSG
ncbi:Dimethyl-sulfide monooxygenase, partial [Lecanosticta acicola]